MNNILRGQIWLVSFNPSRGSEQKGVRPALIIQNDIGNKYSKTTIIAAISTAISDYPQNVFISKSKKNGLSADSMVKLGQILTIDKKRLIKKLGTVSNSVMEKVDYAVQLSLGVV